MKVKHIVPKSSRLLFIIDISKLEIYLKLACRTMININNLSLSTALAFGPLSNILVTTPYCDRFFLFSHSTDSFGLKLSR